MSNVLAENFMQPSQAICQTSLSLCIWYELSRPTNDHEEDKV